MKSLFRIYIPLLMLGMLLSCNHENRMPLFRWTTVGADFDTVILRIERAFNNIESPELIANYLYSLDSLSNNSSGDVRRIRDCRTYFMKGRYAFRFTDKDSALLFTTKALSLVDSASEKYDWLRIMIQLYDVSESSNGVEKYKLYQEAIQYAQRIDDRPLEAQVYGSMGNLMIGIGDEEKAIHCFHVHDSINQALGFWKLPIRNKINYARILTNKGRTHEADSILLSLDGSEALKYDTIAQNTIPRNIFAHRTDDIAYLQKAYFQIKDNPRFRYLRGFYRALLVNCYYRNGDKDAMVLYADSMMEDLPYVKNHDHKAVIWYNRSMVWQDLNRLDSALEARINFENYVDSGWLYQQKNEVIRLSALEEMRRQEEGYRLANARRNWLMALIIAVLVSGGVVAILLLNRRHMRQKMSVMANELELEKAKRKMAANALTIEEKDGVLDGLRNELQEMRKEGEIREGSARRLESTIKAHLSGHEQDEKFREMFDVVNPGFTDRLRSVSPDLADSYVKLACYTLMELDNKKIATLMMIKPESVRQARWRLRQRLNVPDGVALEDFLRDMNRPQ